MKTKPLKETESYFIGECPMCKSDSFAISKNKERFYCFNCHKCGEFETYKYLAELKELTKNRTVL